MQELRKKYSGLPGIECFFPIENFFTFYSRDGLKIANYKYPSSRKTTCLVYFFHGLNGYSNNHAVIAKYLSESGCEVLSIDLRGHGKSEGTPGLIRDFDLLLDDCVKFIKETSGNYGNLPIFIGGGSLGACLCLHINQKLLGMFRGVILMSPALGSQRKCQSIFYCLLSLFHKCCPGQGLVRPNPREFCPDQKIVDYLEENPYIYTGKVRIGTLRSVMQGMKAGKALSTGLNVPFVIVHGSDDRVVDPEFSQVMYREAPVDDKSLWMYNGLTHSLVFEKEIYEIAGRLQKWVNERV